MNKGIVYLVGAGPGDPELITVKGLNVLRKAGVVVYDYLIPFSLLGEAPHGCELISVGKRAGNHTMAQEKISSLLLTQARAGKMVVRLKGGDPFLFGRGSEEAKFLIRHGVRVKVIPGISSAMSVPLAAGIPLTERGLSGSVTFISGSVDGGIAPSDIRRSDTTVFLMAKKNCQQIAQNLLSKGYSANSECAVIENGTRPNQRVFRGSLSEFAASGNSFSKLKGAALFVVGACVKNSALLHDIYEQYTTVNEKRRSGII